MTVGAGAVVNLTGGTKSCNVFWIAEGAISVAANANVKGTLFAKIGAIGLGAEAELEGRMLTLEGAITTGVGAIVGPPLGVSTIQIFCESDCAPAAAVDVLGVISNFALYTNLGAVANTSTSGIDGNIGSNSGGISGYESSIVVGSYNNANTLSAQANIDIDNAYTALMALPSTGTHAAAFGIGETVTAGVYPISGAGSLSGTLFLDTENNPDAIFVFRFAGAFSVAAQSKIILTNGARRCNVFWIGGAGVATGAISIGAGAVLKGTFLSHGGACGSGAGVFLAGRQLSTSGAVTTYSGIIYNNPVCVTSTSLGVPVILAVTETTAAVNGISGGNTTALTLNDLLDGMAVVIGADPGNVTLIGVTIPPGLTLNADGTVTILPNTAAGNYSLTYQICEVTNPTNCSSVTSNIVVFIPDPSDLTVNITASPNVMHGTTQFDVTVAISELLGNSTNGSEILVRVPRDSRVTFTFNPAATLIGFTTVNNSVWTYDGNDAVYHIFKTNSIIAANASSTFGFSATFTPSQSSGGYTITSSLNSGSGGEINGQNNQDAEMVDYFIN
jgi:trimeric autotransporter adhesin